MDFVDQISRLTDSISMGVSNTRLSLRVAPKYRVLLRFKLTRPELPELDLRPSWMRSELCLWKKAAQASKLWKKLQLWKEQELWTSGPKLWTIKLAFGKRLKTL